MQLLIGLLLILALLVGGVWAASAYEANRARALEAQFLMHAQRTTANSNTLLIVLLVAIIVVLLSIIGIYSYWRLKHTLRYWQRGWGTRPLRQRPTPPRRWVGGPHAYWQRQAPLPPGYPYGQYPQGPPTEYPLPTPQPGYPAQPGSLVPTGYWDFEDADDTYYFANFADAPEGYW